MKFSAPALFSVFAYVSAVTAQASHIGYPTQGTNVHKGEQITVQVVRPVEMMGSIEVGMVLSFQVCSAPNPCPSATSVLGEILFNGQFNPERPTPQDQPYKNFTVTIPDFDFWQSGPAQIIENRFHLIGAGPAAILETNTVGVNLVNY